MEAVASSSSEDGLDGADSLQLSLAFARSGTGEA